MDSVPTELSRGVHLSHLLLHLPPDSISGAVTKATHQARIRIFQLVQQQIQLRENLHNTTIARAVVESLRSIQQRLRWSAATLATALGHLASILNRLDAYTNAVPYQLGDKGYWKEFVRHVTKEKHVEKVKQALPLEVPVVEKMVKEFIQAGTTSTAFLLIIAWSHAARVGNVVTLEASNFKGNKQQITWTKAKTVASRGPYTTSSHYPPEFLKLITDHLASSSTTPLCDMMDIDRLRSRLKDLNPLYDLRSLRRGALQHLAGLGTPVRTLLHFSGHTTEKSLFRYLEWGAKYSKDTQAANAAGKNLWTSTSEPMTHSPSIAI